MESFFNKLFGKKPTPSDNIKKETILKLDYISIYNIISFGDIDFNNNIIDTRLKELWYKIDSDENNEIYYNEMNDIIFKNYKFIDICTILNEDIVLLNVSRKYHNLYKSTLNNILNSLNYQNSFLLSYTSTNINYSNNYTKYYLDGHSTVLILGIRRDFQSTCIKIDKYLADLFQIYDTNNFDLSPINEPFFEINNFPGLNIISLLYIFTLFLPNRLVLLRSKFHHWLIKLIRILSKRYSTLLSIKAKELVSDKNKLFEDKHCDDLIEFLEPLLSLCFAICKNLIDPFNIWRGLPTNSYPFSNSKVNPHILSPNAINSPEITQDQLTKNMINLKSLKQIGNAVSDELEELGIIDILTGLIHDISQFTQLNCSGNLINFVCLELVGSLCFYSINSQQSFYHTGVVLPYLVGIFDWPYYFSTIELIKNPTDFTDEIITKLRGEFYFQLLALQVIFQASFCQSDILHYLSRIGMFDKLSKFILWVASTSLFSPTNKNLESELTNNIFNSQSKVEHQRREFIFKQSEFQDPLSNILFTAADALHVGFLNSIASPTADFRNSFESQSFNGEDDILHNQDDEFEEYFLDRAISPLASPSALSDNDTSKPKLNVLDKDPVLNQSYDAFLINNDWLNILQDPVAFTGKLAFNKSFLPNLSKIRNIYGCEKVDLELNLLNINTSSIKFHLPSIDILDCLFYALNAISIQTVAGLKSDNSDMLKLNFLKHVVGLGIGNKSLNITSLIVESISKLYIEDSLENFELDDYQIAKLLFSCNKIKLKSILGDDFTPFLENLPLLPTLQLSTVRLLHSLLDEYKQDFIPILRSCKLHSFIFTPLFYFLPSSISDLINLDSSKAGFNYEKFKNISQNLCTLNGLYPSNFCDHLINLTKLSSLQLFLRMISSTETALNFNQSYEMSDSKSLLDFLESSIYQTVNIVNQILILLSNNTDLPIDINITKNLLILDFVTQIDSILQICHLLIYNLRLNLNYSQLLLSSLPFLTSLSLIINEQISLTEIIYKEKSKLNFQDQKLLSFLDDNTNLARFSVLKLLQYAISNASSKVFVSRESSIITSLFSLLKDGTPHFKYFALKLINSIMVSADGNDIINLNSSSPLIKSSLHKSDLSSGAFAYSPLYTTIRNVFEAQLVLDYNLKSRASSPVQDNSILDVHVDPDYISRTSSLKICEPTSPLKQDVNQFSILIHNTENKLKSVKFLIFSKYIELFSKVQSDYSLVRAMLYGIRFVLSERSIPVELGKNLQVEQNQNIFKEIGTFEQIVSVLNSSFSDTFYVPSVIEPLVETNNDKSKNFLIEISNYTPAGYFKSSLLCIDVIKTLCALVSNNTKLKLYLNDTIGIILPFLYVNSGYSQLKSLIARTEHNIIKSPIFSALFDMLMDDFKFSKEEDSYVTKSYLIKNSHVLGLLLQLLSFTTERIKQLVINKLNRILNHSILNQSYACKAGMVEDLIELLESTSSIPLQKSIINSIEILGSHSLNVKQFKKFFQIMRSSNLGNNPDFNSNLSTRPFFNPLLLQAIQKMQNKDQPKAFFYFDGISSGLKLPTIEKWPSSRGYSFSTWVRIESYEHPDATSLPKRHYQPRLFSFLTSEGLGVEAFFNHNRLTFQIILSPEQVVIEAVDFVLRPCVKWYHIVISHSVGSTFGAPAQLKVFCDSKLRFHKKCVYPIVKRPFTRCFIATDDSAPRPRALFAQLSTIYFFESILTQDQVQGLFSIGSSYMFSFQNSDLPPDTLITMSSFPDMINGSLTSHIFLTYNAKAMDAAGNLFLDNTPELNHFKNDNLNMHALKLPGTHACVSRDVRHTLDCLGGIRLLFPLFAQLDEPTNIMHITLDDASSLDSSNPHFLEQILRVLCEMIHANSSNQAFMQSAHGFGVMNHLLRQVSPLHLNLEVLAALEQLINSVSFKLSLYQTAFQSLFFDGELWIYAPFQIQVSWLEKISAMIKNRSEIFRNETLGVQRVLDMLRFYFWFTPEEPLSADSKFHGSFSRSSVDYTFDNSKQLRASMALHEQVLHPITKEVVGSRPNLKNLKILRRMLIRLILDMVGDFPTQKELNCIILFLLECKDSKQKIDLLILILYWMDLHQQYPLKSADNSVATPYEILQISNNIFRLIFLQGGFDPFMALLTPYNQVINSLCMEVIGRMLPFLSDAILLFGKLAGSYSRASLLDNVSSNSLNETLIYRDGLLDCVSSASSSFTSSADFPTGVPPVSIFSTPPSMSTVFGFDDTKLSLALPANIANRLLVHPVIDSIFSNVYSTLMSAPLSEPLYFVLFSILIGDIRKEKFEDIFTSVATPKVSSKSYLYLDSDDGSWVNKFHLARPNLLLDGTQRIVCPIVISTIFKLLLDAPKQLIQMVLQDIMFLLNEDETGFGDENKLCFLDQVGWQTWIFDIIVTEQNELKEDSHLFIDASQDDHNLKRSNVIVEMSLKMLSMLIWSPMVDKSNGWIYYQDCLGYLVMFSKFRQVSTSDIILPLMKDILNKLSNLNKYQSKISSEISKERNIRVLNNLMNFLRITECFILSRLKNFASQTISNIIEPPSLDSVASLNDRFSLLPEGIYTDNESLNKRLWFHFSSLNDFDKNPCESLEISTRQMEIIFNDSSCFWDILQVMLNLYDLVCSFTSTLESSRNSFLINTGPYLADPSPFIVRCFMISSFFASPAADETRNKIPSFSTIFHSTVDPFLFGSSNPAKAISQLIVANSSIEFPADLFSKKNAIPPLKCNLLHTTQKMETDSKLNADLLTATVISPTNKNVSATQRAYVAALLYAADNAAPNTASHSLNISAILLYLFDLLLKTIRMSKDLDDLIEIIKSYSDSLALKYLLTQSKSYYHSIGLLLLQIHHLLSTNNSLINSLEAFDGSEVTNKYVSEFVNNPPPFFLPNLLLDDESFCQWRIKWMNTFLINGLWSNTFVERLSKLWPLAERVQLSSALTMANHFDSFLELISHRAHTFSSLQQSYLRMQSRAVVSVINEKVQSELNRRAIVSMSINKLANVYRQSWINITRSLTNERAPWYFNDGKRIYWKIDRHENYLRMRCKLQINYLGTSHLDAANDATTRVIPNQSDTDQNDQDKLLKLNFPVSKLLAGINIHQNIPIIKNDVSIAPNSTLRNSKPHLIVNKNSLSPDINGSRNDEVEEDKFVYQIDCAHISPMQIVHGSLELYRYQFYFFAFADSTSQQNVKNLIVTDDDAPSSEELRRKAIRDASRKLPLGVKDHKWNLSSVQQLHFRRHQLGRNSVELFLDDSTTHFFTFFTEKKRDEFFQIFISLNLPRLSLVNSRSPAETIAKSGLTQDWVRRKISNFEYLMKLNTIVGRTFNDLTQYPIFPWILKEYNTATIDLKDPSIYRDLSKPIGALNPDRLAMFIDRYNSFDDVEIPKFHYGTHYSTSGAVLYYLIRMEPFTSLAVHLQGGKFDHADRLFDSLPASWAGVLSNTADVKELIPELFYLADILRNVNGLNLGVKQQSKKQIDDVVLPAWASSPEEFIRIHRAALESEYVSAHLHEWIDLIFGFKQRGQDAVDAHNVFFHLTYEGSVDIESITDPLIREATIAQIDNFGQTPSQIFFNPHPARHLRQDTSELLLNIFDKVEEIKFYLVSQVTIPGRIPNSNEKCSSNAVYFIQHHQPYQPSTLTTGVSDWIVTIGLDRVLSLHKWKSSSPEYLPPFVFELDKSISLALENPDADREKLQKRLGVHFAENLSLKSSCFALSRNGKYILSCGYWDFSFKVSSIEDSQQVQSIAQHKDIVTCLAIDKYFGRTVVTGSKDSTVIIWQFNDSGLALNQLYINKSPLHILFGHDDEVTCVAINCNLDIVVSGSSDGSCIVHSAHGRYIRSIWPSKSISKISAVEISSTGDIMIYSQNDLMLYMYTINGVRLASIDTYEHLHAFTFSRNGEHLVTGGDRQVNIRRVHDLKMIRRLKETSKSIVRSLTLTIEESNLIVGLENGQILIYALDARILRERTLQKLTDLGF